MPDKLTSLYTGMNTGVRYGLDPKVLTGEEVSRLGACAFADLGL